MQKYRYPILSLLVCLLVFCSCQREPSDTHTQQALGKQSITICSQNLFRYGSGSNKKKFRQRKALTERFRQADCDLIGVQEVYGKSKTSALRNLEILARDLSGENRFESYVAESSDPWIRNGFLVNTNHFEVISVENFARRQLPRLSPLGPTTRFGRSPIAIELNLRDRNFRPLRLIAVSFHLKSKANAWKDISGLSFEGLRMCMAQALVDIMQELRPAAEAVPTVVVILGDINSRQDSATAKILSGALSISDFTTHQCWVQPNLTPSCKSEPTEDASQRPQLIGLVSKCLEGLCPSPVLGSYKYKKRYEMIDDIITFRDDLKYFTDKQGRINAGTSGNFHEGSDHLLLSATLGLEKR